MHWAAALATLLLLPLLFVDLRRLSRLSVVGLASSGLVVVMVAALLGLDPRRTAMAQQVGRGARLVPWCAVRWPDAGACNVLDLRCKRVPVSPPARSRRPPTTCQRGHHPGGRGVFAQRHRPLHAAGAENVRRCPFFFD